ncbi:hypothetical protein [Mycobacterium uberis]|uniref:hypothetical protein n=1 Tax=Mycobacterium uberis TaxID=2162698 RepID=UPI001FB476BB|nr:hypothetical protein [Mycobacterium uberis]
MPPAISRTSLVSIPANSKAAMSGITVLPRFLPSNEAALPTLFVLTAIQLVTDTA